MSNMNFSGAALPMNDDDIRIIAGYLGCEIAALKSVLSVESAGKGFGYEDRPIILNEPHIFYRELTIPKQRQRASRENLAYPYPGTMPYPVTQSDRYLWLEKAMAINKDAALASCSWGLGQILGANYKACGFSTVLAFVEAMMYSDGAQLYIMARFIVSNSLQMYLRSRAWAEFARRYNGPSYASNHYDLKLEHAYERMPLSDKVTPPPTDINTLNKLINANN
ncbi:peptidoglycan-binding protein [Microbulbifer sp. A4B17]|uniref:N-acetylmuramidase family protein n=1 Tax=Microbulbifer sp. A4B17 TaxID=359370 RepID=UPI000D52AE25|nr:N-acetylmuramidase family protein [Microbulbifer sp. A4B17]AWF80569.1 peptidoglycan-binding protein [Microbulbifer sp. A4B17]